MTLTLNRQLLSSRQILVAFSGGLDSTVLPVSYTHLISYPDVQWQHESLKPVLEPTYGIILYQEQVMQIAQVLSLIHI